jgi:translin
VDELNTIIGQIQDTLSAKTSVRDQALRRSRELTRMCAQAIRATHREEWDEAAAKIAQARKKADELVTDLKGFPDLYYAGYSQDALKEYVEACLTYALVRNEPLSSPRSLNVEPATYLGGLAEAATELRRRVLDIIRHEHSEEAERLLQAMDAIYTELVAVDYADAITHGLRRRTDVLRGVLERTRGDLTNSLRQLRLQGALRDLERRLDVRLPTNG